MFFASTSPETNSGSQRKFAVLRVFALVVAFALLALGLTYWPGIVRDAGHNIPTDDPLADYIVGLRTAGFLTLLLVALPVSGPVKRSLLIVWAAKLVVTLGLMIFYEDHYDILDSYYYFFDAEREPDWEMLEWGRGSEVVIFITWLTDSVFGRAFHSSKVLFSFVGLLGIAAFGRAATVFLGEREKGTYILFAGFYPSILFWSSVFGKDPVVFWGIGLFTLGVVQLVRRPGRWSAVLFIAGGIAVATVIRVWLGVILLAPTGYILLKGKRSLLAQIALSIAVIALFSVFSTEFLEHFQIESESDLFQNAETISQAWATGGSAQQADISINGWSDFLVWAPIGAFSALFRPFPGELPGAFGFIAGIENLPLYLFCLLAIKRMRRNDFRDPLVVWAVLVVSFWSAIYGLVSYQNLGSAVRFRLQVLPLLLGSALYLSKIGRRKSVPDS